MLLSGTLYAFDITGRFERRLASGGVTQGAETASGELAIVRHGHIFVGRPGSLAVVSRGSDLAWSEDGSSLVFVRAGHLVTYVPATGRFVVLVRGSDPSWSPNGRQIAYIDSRHAVRAMSLSSGHSHAVGGVHGRSVDWGSVPASTPSGCRVPSGSEVVATDTGEVIYLDRGRNSIAGLIACDVRDGELRVIATLARPNEDNADQFSDVAIAGNWVAAIDSYTDVHYGGDTETVNVYELQTGTTAANLGRQSAGCPGYSCDSSMNDLVLNELGDTAVHAFVSDYGTPGQEAILFSGPSGVQTVDTAPAASPPGTALANLALNNQTLTWTHDGAPEALPIPTSTAAPNPKTK